MADDSLDAELVDCFLTEVGDSLTEWERLCLEINSHNLESSLTALFRVAHNVKGSSRTIGLAQLGSFVHEVEDYISGLQKHLNEVSEVDVKKLLSVQGLLVTWLMQLRNNTSYCPDVQPVLTFLKSKVQNEGKTVSPDVQITSAAPTAEQESSKRSSNETIRVRSQKLDQLVQVIGELGIQQAIVMHSLKYGQLESSDCHKAMNMVAKMAKEIQTQAISLRMQELKPLFQRLDRTAKEISYELGKKVHIEIEGADLELDKSIIEAITEPLIHIMRNAVDHGIESPIQRKENNKPETATVLIQAINETDGLRLVIRDDGRGINPEKILAKAVEKGLVKADEKLSRDECLKLIFLPGFSTAEKITSVSGRGVGMDVVKKALDSVNGRTDIESEVGKGTSFKLFLPTSLNIIDSVVVEIQDERYVLPLNNISEIIDLRDNEIKPLADERVNVLRLRDQVLPIEDLQSYLRTHDKKASVQKKGNTEARPAIISNSPTGSVAFAVDRVIGQQRVIVKSVSGRAHYPPQISGATVLSDGKPGLIVALSALAESIAGSYKKHEEAV